MEGVRVLAEAVFEDAVSSMASSTMALKTYFSVISRVTVISGGIADRPIAVTAEGATSIIFNSEIRIEEASGDTMPPELIGMVVNGDLVLINSIVDGDRRRHPTPSSPAWN
ncbi:MAG: hypothetical protein M5R36_18775 [Deltaproteobacteria bacterium]|nr:hypothetical protein [Deltaproteobacteria bacterium]